MTPNQKAFLDTIAFSEIGAALLAVSDNGYNILVGSTPQHPHFFLSYADHPRQLIELPNGLKSTAAGRYQLLERYYDDYSALLGLADFTPASQDAIALQQIKESAALADIEAGNLWDAVRKCAHIWASLPGALYGQHTNNYADLQNAYILAGGTLLTDNT